MIFYCRASLEAALAVKLRFYFHYKSCRVGELRFSFQEQANQKPRTAITSIFGEFVDIAPWNCTRPKVSPILNCPSGYGNDLLFAD